MQADGAIAAHNRRGLRQIPLSSVLMLHQSLDGRKKNDRSCVFGRRQQGGCAGSTDRRPKSAKARSRGTRGTRQSNERYEDRMSAPLSMVSEVTCISAYRGTEESTVGISANARSAATGGWWTPGRCGSPCERVLAAAAVLDHALHADNTRVDRGNPATAVLSTGYRPLGSCSRAPGWSTATLCLGPSRHIEPRRLSRKRGEADIGCRS